MQRKNVSLLAVLTTSALLAGCWGSSSSSSVVSSSSSSSVSSSSSSSVSSSSEVSSSSSSSSVDPNALRPSDVQVLNQTFSADLYTLDYLATYRAADSEVLVNLVDGLVEYDRFGILRPSLAESWEVSADGLEYTFNLRDTNWVTNEGVVYGAVTADDFVAGFQHLLDSEGGLEYIPWGVVANAYEYSMGTVTFDQVGVTAVDADTVKYTLEQATPYFMTMLTYNPFMPLNRAFFIEQGGAFGKAEFALASASIDYAFGIIGQNDSILYNGAYIMSGYASNSLITLTRNAAYWDLDNTNIVQVNYIFDDGSNPDATFTAFINGVYPALGISSATLARAQSEIPEAIYATDTNAVSYFGAFNLDRETYALTSGAVASTKTEQEKLDTKKAVMNANFRKAILHAFDRPTWNGAVVGQALKLNAIRNMLTAPTFVTLPGAALGYEAGADYHEVVAAELALLDDNFEGKSLADAQDPFFDATLAQAYIATAKTELEALGVTFPVKLDIVYYSPSVNQTNQANSFAQSIETVLGAANVDVQLVSATTVNDYYNSGYRAPTGAAANYDFFYGSGWGPDYGDPATYLNIFKSGGDMMHVLGLDIGNDVGTVADTDAFAAVLPTYDALVDAAKAELDLSERYVLMAKAEAALLDSAVFVPTTTQGGNYAASRIFPRTIPFSLFGTDNEKFKNIVIANRIITADERAALIAQWEIDRAAAFAAE